MRRSPNPLARLALIGSTLLAVPSTATAGEVLIFAAPGRAAGEATKLKGKKYGGRATIHKTLPAAQILEEIEKRGASGTKISVVEIIGHGNPAGPFITGEGIRDRSERLTPEALEAWVTRLRGEGMSPRDFFAPDARFTIRACWVGKGDLPTTLLELMPPGATVESDFGYYKNNALSVIFGGAWERKRVTTRTKDVVYKKGHKGATEPYDRLRKKEKPPDPADFVGWWEGKAKVELVRDSKGKRADISYKEHDIPHGAFIITKVEVEGKTFLELEYKGNTMNGEPRGSEFYFSPHPERGGNMKGAHFRFEDGKLKGELVAANDKVHIVRTLVLEKK